MRADGASTTLDPVARTPAGSSAVAAAVAAIARGEVVVVTDDASRENEADLILGAEHATPEKIAFVVRHTTGILCVSLPGERLDELRLGPMTAHSTDPRETAFTVSVDARHGTTTGVSASDRATTIRALSDAAATTDDFLRPGHVFPLRARVGGVLRRRGHTEAALDLARLAGARPAAVLAEIVRDDGAMAREGDARAFARRHGLAMISIAELARHRRAVEPLIEPAGTVSLPTRHGIFSAHAYRSTVDGVEHLALTTGDLGAGEPPLVRVHSECLTGDVLGSRRCDCGEQLELALAAIALEGRGALVYVRGHEGRGIGLGRKLQAYALQDRGLDTVEANVELGLPVDARDYHVPAQILRDLGMRRVRLLTNSPDKVAQLGEYGIEIAERVGIVAAARPERADYLETKRTRLHHVLDRVPSVGSE
jgi:3,4-dihydroxy 2-butanone 4-phosphate synthase/GTP cyclohydrolase II